MEWWKEYFEDLLNLTDIEEAETEDAGLDLESEAPQWQSSRGG